MITAADPRLDVLDNAARFLRAFPVGSMDVFTEWELLDGLVGHARSLLGLNVPAERVASRFNSDLKDELANVGLSPADVESVVASAGNGKLVGRVAIAWANRQEADRQARATPEPEAQPEAEGPDYPTSTSVLVRLDKIGRAHV
jgi:hypothetical protein